MHVLVLFLVGLFAPLTVSLTLTGIVALFLLWSGYSCFRDDYSGDGGLAFFALTLLAVAGLAALWIGYLLGYIFNLN